MTDRTASAAMTSARTVEPTVAWEETACPLCGADAGAPVLEAADPLPPPSTGLVFAVVTCAGCGLSYTNPRPSARSIGTFYPADYSPHRMAPDARRRRAARPFWARLSGRPCAERRGVLPWPGPGRLLDFGCGSGGYLKTMADRGWRVTGLDACARAVDQVREVHGLPALVGTLPHADLQPGSFDVITMWHSLEHAHLPLDVLRAAFELLVPGGKLIVATPNLASVPYRVFGRNWFGLDLPRHLTHFTPKTLGAILTAAGFRADPVRQLRHSDWLRSSARLAERTGQAPPLTAVLRWKPTARLAAWLCYAVGGADCITCVATRPE
ncbi:MAG: class I SAM-dependent methyltransferase [Gemmata sp.]